MNHKKHAGANDIIYRYQTRYRHDATKTTQTWPTPCQSYKLSGPADIDRLLTALSPIHKQLANTPYPREDIVQSFQAHIPGRTLRSTYRQGSTSCWYCCAKTGCGVVKTKTGLGSENDQPSFRGWEPIKRRAESNLKPNLRWQTR